MFLHLHFDGTLEAQKTHSKYVSLHMSTFENFLYTIWDGTVDGGNPANQLRLVVYPNIYKVSYIPGGARFQPSTVSPVKMYTSITTYHFLFVHPVRKYLS